MEKNVFEGPSPKNTRGRWWEAVVLYADCEVGGKTNDEEVVRQICCG